MASLDNAPPKEFICPLSGEIMNNPVILSGDGETYDKQSLLMWFEVHTKLPNSSDEADEEDKTFVSNKKLRKKIEKYINEQKNKKINNDIKEEKNEEKKDNYSRIKHLQLVKFIELECLCESCEKGFCKDTEPLYSCGVRNCPYRGLYLCETCGKSMHLILPGKKKHQFMGAWFPLYRAYNGLVKYMKDKSNTIGKLCRNLNFEYLQPAASMGKGATIAGGTALFLTSAISNTASAGVAAGTMFVIDTIVNGVRWLRGDISGKEFWRLEGKSVVQNGVIFGCVAAGVALGTIVPGVGNVIGGIIGGIVGVIGGVAASHYLGKKYDKAFPPETIKASNNKEDIIRDCLLAFNYDIDDLIIEDRFNEKEISARYRKRCLEVHPDRPNGNKAKFHELQMQFSVLIALTKQGIFSRKRVLNDVRTRRNTVLKKIKN